jgi:hypothetical protein
MAEAKKTAGRRRFAHEHAARLGRLAARQRRHNTQWIWGTINQTPTILSLLTPEYQKRMVQMNYHEGVDNAPQWEASFCYPEGYMRWWTQASGGGNFQLITSPTQVQLMSGTAANFFRQFLIGRQHVQKVPQWYGEAIAFWDKDKLVVWTANVQAWTISHSMFEFSGQLETIETFEPRRDASGNFVGLTSETWFYDAEAFVQPLYTLLHYNRQAKMDDANRRYTYIECLSNLRNTNGRPTQLTAADPRYIDYYGRPWAQNWERFFEQGWDKPNEDFPRTCSTCSINLIKESKKLEVDVRLRRHEEDCSRLSRWRWPPALAHHSFAMFDQTKTVTWTGVATRFVAQANHAEIQFVPLGPDGKAMRDKDGKPVSWGV